MQSLESCWNYLRYATADHVIISLGADGYDIVSIGPNSLGEYFIEKTPTQVVGVFSPGIDWITVADAAEALKATKGEETCSKISRSFAHRWSILKLATTRRMVRYFNFSARQPHRRDESS